MTPLTWWRNLDNPPEPTRIDVPSPVWAGFDNSDPGEREQLDNPQRPAPEWDGSNRGMCRWSR